MAKYLAISANLSGLKTNYEFRDWIGLIGNESRIGVYLELLAVPCGHSRGSSTGGKGWRAVIFLACIKLQPRKKIFGEFRFILLSSS